MGRERVAPPPLVKRPLGSGYDGGHNWPRMLGVSGRDSGPVTCELCGTTHPETAPPDDHVWDGDYDGDQMFYAIYNFLGYRVVYKCCGMLIDKLFQTWGEGFAHQFIKDAGDGRVKETRTGTLLWHIKCCLEHLQGRREGDAEMVKQSQALLGKLQPEVPGSG